METCAKDSHVALSDPSEWVRRWAHLIPAGATVLDLACGSGRHSRFLAALGYQVIAVDRDAGAITSLGGVARITALVADLECAPWPFGDRTFGGIVVTNYLHRPLLGSLVYALAPGGVLIYETFSAGNEKFGKPSNPTYLLQPGELLGLAGDVLRVVAYEDVQVADPRPAMVQRLCAERK